MFRNLSPKFRSLVRLVCVGMTKLPLTLCDLLLPSSCHHLRSRLGFFLHMSSSFAGSPLSVFSAVLSLFSEHSKQHYQTFDYNIFLFSHLLLTPCHFQRLAVGLLFRRKSCALLHRRNFDSSHPDHPDWKRRLQSEFELPH